MNRLKDFNLKRGDWVKLLDGSWVEYQDCIKGTYHYCGYYFSDVAGAYGEDAPCKEVLRPSIIIRDKLDEALKYQSTYNLSFEIIHPKINSVIPLNSKLDELIEGTKEMLLKLDEIEKNILESSK